jgi:aminoglycoside phosphotransferase (APT) family kinase protein
LSDLVRALLRDQHPDLADLELRDVEGGCDTKQFRPGEKLAVRLPRTARPPGLLRTEQRWLPELASRRRRSLPGFVPRHIAQHLRTRRPTRGVASP